MTAHAGNVTKALRAAGLGAGSSADKRAGLVVRQARQAVRVASMHETAYSSGLALNSARTVLEDRGYTVDSSNAVETDEHVAYIVVTKGLI